MYKIIVCACGLTFINVRSWRGMDFCKIEARVRLNDGFQHSGAPIPLRYDELCINPFSEGLASIQRSKSRQLSIVKIKVLGWYHSFQHWIRIT